MKTDKANEQQITTAIGFLIRNARKAKGLSLMQLAAAVDSTPNRIGEYERGRNMPRFTALARICRALDINLETMGDQVMRFTETNKKGPAA